MLLIDSDTAWLCTRLLLEGSIELECLLKLQCQTEGVSGCTSFLLGFFNYLRIHGLEEVLILLKVDRSAERDHVIS